MTHRHKRRFSRPTQATALLLALFSVHCSPPTASERISVVDRNLFYGPASSQRLDVFTPKQRTEGLAPAAIVIHGGGWETGRKERLEDRVCLRYLERGFVVANIEYRKSIEAPAPACIEDVRRAAHFFVTQSRRWRIDPARIVVMGESAGSHLALMAVFGPSPTIPGPPLRAAAIVSLSTIADVRQLLTLPEALTFTKSWLRTAPDLDSEAGRLSPLSYVRPGLPPVLAVHSRQDPLIPADSPFSPALASYDIRPM